MSPVNRIRGWQQPVVELVRERVGDRKARLLEAGCGSAHAARRLADDPNFQVTCCDIHRSDRMPQDVPFCRVDLCETLPFADGSFDVVVCTEVIEHLKAQLLTLEEFARVLKPDGLLVLTLPNFWSARMRWHYLLTGNFSTSRFFDPRARAWYRANACPHITNTTLPMLEYALASMGIELQAMRVGARRKAVWPFWPVAGAIRLLNLFRRPKLARRLMLSHTNHWRVLLGGDHVMLLGCKVGLDAVPTDVRPLPHV